METINSISNNPISDNTPDHFAFIIGAMKSGTTSLFEVLSQHPQICPSKTKEPDYFIKDRDNNSLQDYLSLWDWQNSTHAVALESSVAYTKDPFITGAPERIHKAELGQYRFIYMLRNPLTRIESQVRHGLFAGWGKPLDVGIPEDAISYSRYAMQLDKYLKYFPMNTILLITLEEFVESPTSVLSQICQFLEIDKNFAFKDVKTTRNSGEFFNTSASISRITQSKLGQFIAHSLLSKKNKTLLRNFIVRLSKRKNTKSDLGRWKLTPEERDLVLHKLADDLKRLESHFGVNIQKHWQIQTDTLNQTLLK